ncbi:MAG: bifunctional diguanylate cyclase/phosphodiesterase [Desulfopila sp.]|jgi:diguanylate cyclase (GGDEF)-like protein|nr:bifunctional diguanylate cyclase/phosphodiesterase [Desulfopila sp.]
MMEMKIVPLHGQDILPGKESVPPSCTVENKNALQSLIRKNSFDAHFQPIISTSAEDIFAYEGLCRVIGVNPFGTIDQLFEQARRHGEICSLDMLCRDNVLRLAAQHDLNGSGAQLFINVCPTSLQQREHNIGETERMVQAWGLKKEDVVLEITEQEAVSDYPFFLKAIEHYRSRGFRIAIDDFGAGYGGMKMLSLVAPDFVKIDSHFFRDIDSAHINYSLIDAIATICHRIGIDVIAEGIETENDVKVCQDFDIQLLQGYYFARPAPGLLKKTELLVSPEENVQQKTIRGTYDEAICIEEIVSLVQTVHISERVLKILDIFGENPEVNCLPVLSGDKVCGMINRHRFMERHMVGRHGHGMNLNYYKKVTDILDDEFLQVPNYMPIEEVAKKINLRKNFSMYDDICVTRSGKYIGTVAVGAILNAVTDKSILYAKGANPLTGLPGNEFIQREIMKMLSQSVHFDICYIDIDYFKPYNDKHGYAMGDEVIKAVGLIAVKSAKKFRVNGIGFAGHIGGDDFILITRPKQSIAACEYIIDRFSSFLPRFHTQESVETGCYTSRDRQGNTQEFPLLSVSIGIVSTEVHHITSAAEVSSIAGELKKRAKDIPGSAIVRDRRGQSWYEQQGRGKAM